MWSCNCNVASTVFTYSATLTRTSHGKIFCIISLIIWSHSVSSSHFSTSSDFSPHNRFTPSLTLSLSPSPSSPPLFLSPSVLSLFLPFYVSQRLTLSFPILSLYPSLFPSHSLLTLFTLLFLCVMFLFYKYLSCFWYSLKIHIAVVYFYLCGYYNFIWRSPPHKHSILPMPSHVHDSHFLVVLNVCFLPYMPSNST